MSILLQSIASAHSTREGLGYFEYRRNKTNLEQNHRDRKKEAEHCSAMRILGRRRTKQTDWQ